MGVVKIVKRIQLLKKNIRPTIPPAAWEKPLTSSLIVEPL
jgi:hypothetical protein